jgi:tripartite-type tricarboxylate transporter receptor subunit TctC
MPSRRTIGMGLAMLAAGTGQARAQAWAPARPLRVIVPFGAGGPADIYARVLAERLAAPLGQPIVVENRPGAGALVGTDLAAKSPPDGHTLLLMSNAHTANETLIANRPYVLLRDFAAIAGINIAAHVLVAKEGLAARSVPELIALAKARPGALNFASSGPGTPYHIAGEAFRAAAGIEVVHVPFRGSGEARTAIVSGTVDYMFDSITTQLGNISASRVRGLATTGAARSPLLAELPTVAETLPGFTAAIWLGVMAPAGTPEAAIARLNAEIVRLAGAEETRAAWARQAVEPLLFTPAEFRAFVEADIAAQRAVIQAARISVD